MSAHDCARTYVMLSFGGTTSATKPAGSTENKLNL